MPQNSYGFDSNHAEKACEQLQELISMKTEDFRVIKEQLKDFAHEYLDVSKVGIEQLDKLELIEDKIQEKIPAIFSSRCVGSRAPRRLRFARQVILHLHRSRRALVRKKIRYAQPLRIQKEDQSPSPQATKQIKQEDLNSLDIRALAPSNLGNVQTPKRKSFEVDGAVSKQKDQPPKKYKPKVVTATIKNKEVDVIVVDDSDEEENVPPIAQPAQSSTSRRSANIPLLKSLPEALRRSVTYDLYPSSSDALALPSSSSYPPLTPPSNSIDEATFALNQTKKSNRVQKQAITDFLRIYPSPPMNDYTNRFIKIGIRNTIRLNYISKWTPEERLELFRGLPANGDVRVTAVDLLALEFGFVKYKKDLDRYEEANAVRLG